VVKGYGEGHVLWLNPRLLPNPGAWAKTFGFMQDLVLPVPPLVFLLYGGLKREGPHFYFSKGIGARGFYRRNHLLAGGGPPGQGGFMWGPHGALGRFGPLGFIGPNWAFLGRKNFISWG